MHFWVGLAAALVATAIVAMLGASRTARAEPKWPRAFVAWSRDGNEVLCVEGEVAQKPAGQLPRVAPRRWVVLDATAPKPLPVLWSADATEPSEKLRSALAARGFDPAVLELPGQAPPSLEGGPGESVVLEGAGLRGRLDQRGHLAAVPARAFLRPDGARAFVIPDERVIEVEPIVTLTLPAGVRRVPNPGVPTYVFDGLDGVLQLTPMRGVAAKVVPPGRQTTDGLRQLAAGYRWRILEELGSGSYSLGNWAALRCDDPTAGMHILAFLLTQGADIVFATFIGRAPVSPEQVEAIAAVVRTAR